MNTILLCIFLSFSRTDLDLIWLSGVIGWEPRNEADARRIEYYTGKKYLLCQRQ